MADTGTNSGAKHTPRTEKPRGRRKTAIARVWVSAGSGQITVNTAFIESKDRAVMGVLEEGIHIVFEDPELKSQWDAVKAQVTQEKIDAQIARGYSPEVALEEAAVAEVLDYVEQNRKGGTIGEFLASLWTKLKELLGIGNEYDAKRNQIIQRALQALKTTPAVSAQQDAEYMAAVERGDTATAQRMVDEAAKRAGYTIGPVYHGTPVSPFNEFDVSKQGRLDEGFLGAGFYFSGSPDTAWLYAEIPKDAPQGSRSGAWRRRKFANRSGYVGSFLLKGNLLELQEQIIGRRERDRTEVIRESLGLQPLASARQVTEEALRRGYSGVRYTSRYGGEEYAIFSPSQIKSSDPITRDDAGNVIPLSQRFSSASNDIRFSRGNGLFLSRAEASGAIEKAQQVGGDVGTIAQTAQIQGELIPRSIVSDVEALGASANRVEKLAARILSPLKSIGDLADQTWLAPFTRFNPTARMASDGGSAAEIAAEAVVRADLAIKARHRTVKEKLVRAEAALMEAIDNLPKAVVADSDATMDWLNKVTADPRNNRSVMQRLLHMLADTQARHGIDADTTFGNIGKTRLKAVAVHRQHRRLAGLAADPLPPLGDILGHAGQEFLHRTREIARDLREFVGGLTQTLGFRTGALDRTGDVGDVDDDIFRAL